MISIEQLHSLNDKKREIKKEVYTKILEQFTRKIKFSAERGLDSTLLVVPQLVLGCPTFDRAQAAMYMERQLIRGGYDAKRVDDVTVWTSWKKKPPKPQKTQEQHDLDGLANLQKIAKRFKN